MALLEFKSDVWDAANTGDLHELMTALRSYPHLIDTPNPHKLGRTPLFIAAEQGYVKIIEKLVELGSHAIDTPDNYGRTPMFRSASNGHVSVIETLVRLGSTAIDTPDENDRTPLTAASSVGHGSVIETLVRLGSKGIDTSCSSWSPVHCAARAGNTNCVKILMSLGADTSTTPTFLLRPEMVEQLNAGVDEDGSTEVRYRVYFRPSLVSRLLVELEVQHHRRMRLKGKGE